MQGFLSTIWFFFVRKQCINGELWGPRFICVLFKEESALWGLKIKSAWNLCSYLSSDIMSCFNSSCACRVLQNFNRIWLLFFQFDLVPVAQLLFKSWHKIRREVRTLILCTLNYQPPKGGFFLEKDTWQKIRTKLSNSFDTPCKYSPTIDSHFSSQAWKPTFPGFFLQHKTRVVPNKGVLPLRIFAATVRVWYSMAIVPQFLCIFCVSYTFQFLDR